MPQIKAPANESDFPDTVIRSLAELFLELAAEALRTGTGDLRSEETDTEIA